MKPNKIMTDFAAPTVMVPREEESMSVIDPRAAVGDRLLGRQVKETLDELYPGWSWGIEIPAPFYGRGHDALIIRNYDCDPRGKMGFFIRKSTLSGGNMRMVVMRAAGEFLERYKMRRAGFKEEETADRKLIFEKPEV